MSETQPGIRFKHLAIALALIAAALIVLPWVFAPKPKTFTIHFPSNEGVSKGTDVVVAGIVVGEVTAVNLSPTGKGVDAIVELQRKHETAVFAPPHTRAVLRRKGVILPRTRIEVLNEGTTPIAAGESIDGANDEVQVAIIRAGEATREAAELAAKELKRLQESPTFDQDEWKAAMSKARETAAAALAEAESLASSGAGRVREFAESEDGKRYRTMLKDLVATLDDTSSATMQDVGGAAERLGKDLKNLAGELGGLDRGRTADHLDTALTEIHRATTALHKLGQNIAVDVVRGPSQDDTSTMTLELDTTEGELPPAEAEAP